MVHYILLLDDLLMSCLFLSVVVRDGICGVYRMKLCDLIFLEFYITKGPSSNSRESESGSHRYDIQAIARKKKRFVNGGIHAGVLYCMRSGIQCAVLVCTGPFLLSLVRDVVLRHLPKACGGGSEHAREQIGRMHTTKVWEYTCTLEKGGVKDRQKGLSVGNMFSLCHFVYQASQGTKSSLTNPPSPSPSERSLELETQA
jgi:hypothetical protein